MFPGHSCNCAGAKLQVMQQHTMRFVSTAQVLARRMFKYCGTSQCMSLRTTEHLSSNVARPISLVVMQASLQMDVHRHGLHAGTERIG